MDEQRLLLGIEALALQGSDPGTLAYVFVPVSAGSVSEHGMLRPCARVWARATAWSRSRTGLFRNPERYDSSFLMNLAGNGFQLFSFASFLLSCLLAM